MKKTGFVVSGIVVVFLIGGGWYTKHVVTQKVGNQVAQILSQPSTEQEITKIIHSKSLQAAVQGLGGSGSTGDVGAPTSGLSKGDTTGGSAIAGQGSSGTSVKKGQSTTGASRSLSNNSPSSNGSSSSNNSGTQNLHFRNRQQVVQFIMGRLSPGQLTYLMSMYMKRNQLSATQKDAVKQDILSHFTPAEIQAMIQGLAKTQ